MNKWKIAFWICLAILLLITSFGFYSIIDQAITMTYQKEGYTDTINDRDNLIEIINKTNLTKTQIEKELTDDKLYEYMDYLGEIESIILDLSSDSPELADQLKQRFKYSFTGSELLLSSVSFLLKIQQDVNPKIADKIINLQRFCNQIGLYPIGN